MRKLILPFFLFIFQIVNAQPRQYSIANAHSHNDYEKANPFHEAVKHRFGSIEADIFLLDDGQLYVAHTWADLNKTKRTLDSLYLKPLVDCIRKNKGSVYSNSSLELQLLIDIKTTATPTLNRLVATLKRYPELTTTKTLKVVISGNRPQADSFQLFPSYIYFDGVIGTTYSQQALSRIPLFSASFRDFSSWKGYDTIPSSERMKLLHAINEAHKLGKPVRLWAAPDHAAAWKELMKLGVDYINTDHISELSEFLKKQ